MDHDQTTTLIGAILAVISSTQVDYGKVAQGDTSQIAKLGFAAGLGLLGYFSNKKKKSSLL